MSSKSNKNKSAQKSVKDATKDEVINEVLDMEVPTPKVNEPVEETVIEEPAEQGIEENIEQPVENTNMEQEEGNQTTEEPGPMFSDEEISQQSEQLSDEITEVQCEKITVQETVEIEHKTVEETVEKLVKTESVEETKAQPARRRKTAYEAYGYNIGGWGIDE